MTETKRKPVAEGLIALLVCLFLLFLAGPKLVGPAPIDPDHPFDTQATLDRLARILGDESPHPVDSAASDGVIERLLLEIESLGFEPAIDDAFHCSESWSVVCARVRNVGFWVTEPGPDAVMVASHHDSVPTGPGAADDGMGVASSLEIARIMRDRDRISPLARPLYVLITDAEEVGLVGASHFVQNSPVAPLIGAVVSLEARGNMGIANMFETSDPNGRDLAALARFPGTLVKGPTSNSLAVDIYRAMPNGTDVTEYLKLDMDAANYAMVGRPSHYHTPLDDLDHLDPDAVFHMGVSALAGVNGFMSVDASSPDTPKLYSDVLGLGVIAIPQVMALPLMGLGLLLCGVAIWRRRGSAVWRVILWPFATLAVGGLAAWLAGFAIDALRPEPAHGTAYPVALRGLFLSIALGVGVLMSRALYRPEGVERHLGGVWLIMLALGCLGSLFMPGVATLFALPALLVVPGAVLLILRIDLAARILFALAALLLVGLLLPMNALAESALFVENSAPLTIGVLWIFLASLPLMWREAASTRRAGIGAAIIATGFAVAALIVPAYTPGQPQGMNILHIQSDDRAEPHYRLNTRRQPPEAMRAARSFYIDSLDEYWSAAAAPLNSPDVSFEITGMEQTTETQTIQLQIRAGGADSVQLTSATRGQDTPLSMTVNGQTVSVGRGLHLRCFGRSCNDLSVEMVFEPTQASRRFRISATANGLEPDADALVLARPDWAVPQHRGDRRIRQRTIEVGAE